MHIRSLGWRTDLIFPRFDGVVTDRGDYLVVRTPSNPGFYWGNFLLLDAPAGPLADSWESGKYGYSLACLAFQENIPYWRLRLAAVFRR